jgi:hypothetical protein
VTISSSLGSAASFASIYNGVVYISPTLKTPAGSYPIAITLTDSAGITFKYTLNILVLAISISSSSISSSSDSSNFSSLTEYNNESNKSTNENPIIVSNIITKGMSTTLTAKISAISQAGLMTVTFNEALQVPSNFSLFNYRIMNITIKPGSESDVNNLLFNWTLVSFTSS